MNRGALVAALASVALAAAGMLVACGSDDEGAAPLAPDGGPDAPLDGGGGTLPDAALDAAPDAREAGPDGSARCSDDGWCHDDVPDAGGASYTLLSVAARGPSDVWAAGGRLLHFDGSAWAEEPVPDAPIIQSVHPLAAPATSLLAASNEGVSRRDADGTWHLEYGAAPYATFSAGKSVLRASPTNGQIYVGVKDISGDSPVTRLFRRSLTGTPTWTSIAVPTALGGLNDMTIDASGNIWVAADFAVGFLTTATSKWVVNAFLDPLGSQSALAIGSSAGNVWLGGQFYDALFRPKLVAGAITLPTESLHAPSALSPQLNAFATTGATTGWAVGGELTFGDDPIQGIDQIISLPLVVSMANGTNTIERLLPQGGFEIGTLHDVWASASDVWAVGETGNAASAPPAELIVHKKVMR